MPALTSDELIALRCPAQRHRMYLATWGTWRIETYTELLVDLETDPPTPIPAEHVAESDFQPVLNIGPHRLAFVGEAITFDASDSFERGGGAVTGGTWAFPGGSSTSASGVGPHEISWATAGLKTITYTNGTTVATRWVRVLTDRDSLIWDVTSVSGLSGTKNDGWRCEITVAPRDGRTIGLADFTAIGLFCEDEWELEPGVWTRRPIGPESIEPRLVIAGYATDLQISKGSERHQVTIRLGGLKDVLESANIHQTFLWRGGTHVTGTILDLDKMTIQDAILWLLQFKTNVLGYHDFETFWDDSGDIQDQDVPAIASSADASVWATLSDWSGTDFGSLTIGPGMKINYHGDPLLRVQPAWVTKYPNRMHITASDIWEISGTEDKQKNVVYVELTFTAVPDEDGTDPSPQKTVKYPAEPPGGSGDWLFKRGLIGTDTTYFQALVEQIYRDANRRYAINLKTGLNRAFKPNDRVRVTLQLEDRNIDWDDKIFYVVGVGADADAGLGTYSGTLSLLEYTA